MIRSDINILLKKSDGPAISIYIPTHCVVDIQQDRIRFKNSLRDAETKLLNMGLRDPDARNILEPALKLITDSEFWKCQGSGLAFFISQRIFVFHKLPFSFKETVEVGDCFHIRPLLNMLSGDRMFYVLAISLGKVRLLQCSGENCQDVTPVEVPKGIEEVLRFDQFEKQRQYHTVGTRSTVGRSPMMSHGQAVGKEIEKEQILRYFQQVDRGLHGLLREEQAPMVLAGVDYLHSIYHQANKYRYLLPKGINGNPEGLSNAELHQQAWVLMEPFFQSGKVDAIQKYLELAGTGYSTSDLKEAVLAAYEGRVSTLFVDFNTQKWGSFLPRSREVYMFREEKPGSQDLLDLAAAYTLIKRGTVYTTNSGEIPGTGSVAAVFRH